MSPYVRTYLVGMGYDPRLSFDDQWIPCELCNRKAVDVHHIDARGMGGNDREYPVEELMGLCRICHEETGDRRDLKIFLRLIHKKELMIRTIARIIGL